MNTSRSISFSRIPVLHLRKDIWSHFPVCLVKMPYTDNHDRYAIRWHKKHLMEWSQGTPSYETIVKDRLMTALKTCSKWTVEPAANHDDLCVIAMNFSETPRVFDSLPDIEVADPSITTLEDMNKYFPVCWKIRNNKYYIEFHNTQVRALADKYSLPEDLMRFKIKEKLIKTLSTNWSVSPVNHTSLLCVVAKQS